MKLGKWFTKLHDPIKFALDNGEVAFQHRCPGKITWIHHRLGRNRGLADEKIADAVQGFLGGFSPWFVEPLVKFQIFLSHFGIH
jgi:hypothetical protein